MPHLSRPAFLLLGSLALAALVGCANSLDPNGACAAEDISWVPVASAGPDQQNTRNRQVLLEGSAADVPPGATVTYRWEVLAPDGSEESTYDATARQTWFVGMDVGTYVATLTTSNSCHSTSDQVQIVLTNTAPVAVASVSSYQLQVDRGERVYLSSTGSSDPDQDPISYLWSFVSKPSGSAAAFSSTSATAPEFVPDVPGDYVISLTVSDGLAQSSAQVTVTALNYAPVAGAGTDRFAHVGDATPFSQEGSSDGDGDALTYQWTLVTRPLGSAAQLASPTSATPTLTPDLEGLYEVELTVHDGFEASAPDRALLTAYREIAPLSYAVIDAEYSDGLERIVAVSTSPNQLHIIDPLAGTEQVVDLPLAPSSVGVSPDGTRAAIGHDAWITHVDLTTAQAIGAPFPVSISVGDVVVSSNRIYGLPWGSGEIVSIDPGAASNNTKYSSASLSSRTRAKLHPGETAMYGANSNVSPTDTRKLPITSNSGTAEVGYDSRYHGDYYVCGHVWGFEDGSKILTGCGAAFTTVPSATSDAADLEYGGSLDGTDFQRVVFAHHDETTNRWVTVMQGFYGNNADRHDGQLRLYSGDFLAYQSSIDLPHFVLSGVPHQPHGKFVFTSEDGSRIFVIQQANASAGISPPWGLVAY